MTPASHASHARLFAAEWKPTGFPDRTSEETYRRRVGTLLDNFWTGELSGAGEALHEELPFELRLDPGDGSPAVRIIGSIDRVDGLASGRPSGSPSTSPRPRSASPRRAPTSSSTPPATISSPKPPSSARATSGRRHPRTTAAAATTVRLPEPGRVDRPDASARVGVVRPPIRSVSPVEE